MAIASYISLSTDEESLTLSLLVPIGYLDLLIRSCGAFSVTS